MVSILVEMIRSMNITSLMIITSLMNITSLIIIIVLFAGLEETQITKKQVTLVTICCNCNTHSVNKQCVSRLCLHGGKGGGTLDEAERETETETETRGAPKSIVITFKFILYITQYIYFYQVIWINL